MNCEHGFLMGNCPHCFMQSKVKPQIILKDVNPTEIELPIPNQDKITNSKDLENSDFFIPTKTLDHIPLRVKRNFELRNTIHDHPPSLFEVRKRQIDQKQDPKNIAQQYSEEISVINLRKKFSKM